jgi:hypothetical protein
MPRTRTVLRPLSLLLLTSASLALAACGGDDGGGGTGTSGATASGGDDRDAITAVVTGYAQAFSDGDTEKACGYLSKSGLEQVEAAAKQLDEDGCAGVLAEAADQLGDDAKQTLGTLQVTDVKVDGDRATVTTAVPGYDNQESDPATLVKEDGAWKIAADVADSDTETATAATVTAQTVTTP